MTCNIIWRLDYIDQSMLIVKMLNNEYWINVFTCCKWKTLHVFQCYIVVIWTSSIYKHLYRIVHEYYGIQDVFYPVKKKYHIFFDEMQCLAYKCVQQKLWIYIVENVQLWFFSPIWNILSENKNVIIYKLSETNVYMYILH